MGNPLAFIDQRGNTRIEPSVSGEIQLQTIDPVNPTLVNDLIVLSPFRSGVPASALPPPLPLLPPAALVRNRQLSAIRALHDPDNNGDHGVGLCATAKAAFADPLFSAADILTCRVGSATPSTSDVVDGGAAVLGTIRTGDYGSQTTRSRRQITRGTLSVGNVHSFKVWLADDVRQYGTLPALSGTPSTGDSLGILMALQYVGNGGAATLTIRQLSGVLTWIDQPDTGDTFPINGVVFSFDPSILTGSQPDTLTAQGYFVVSSTSVVLKVASTAALTWKNLWTAINANVVPGVVAAYDATALTVTATGLEVGVAMGAPSSTLHFNVVGLGVPTAMLITLSSTAPTDGSQSLNIPLGLSQFSTLQALQAYINQQVGYVATLIPGVNKFLPSSSFDMASGDVKTAAVALTGYMASIADFINTRTQGHYLMSVAKTGTPVVDPTPIYLTGGSTPPLTAQNWEDALTLVGTKLQLGGIILLDTTDPSIFAMCDEFIIEQWSKGRWFRGYYGTEPGLDETTILEIVASLNSVDEHVCCQRPATFGANDAIVYLDPAYGAAAMAGGAAGNVPWQNPLTMKRTKFIGLHPDDDYDQTTREDLESGGVTVFKTENGQVLCAFDVTTSLDPDRRMPRITSEVATVKLFEMNLQAALAQYRGTWAGTNYLKRVTHTFQAIASGYEAQGALAAGVDERGAPQAAWALGDVTLLAGVLQINYSIWIAGEVSQISESGVANYQRLVEIPTT